MESVSKPQDKLKGSRDSIGVRLDYQPLHKEIILKGEKTGLRDEKGEWKDQKVETEQGLIWYAFRYNGKWYATTKETISFQPILHGRRGFKNASECMADIFFLYANDKLGIKAVQLTEEIDKAIPKEIRNSCSRYLLDKTYNESIAFKVHSIGLLCAGKDKPTRAPLYYCGGGVSDVTSTFNIRVVLELPDKLEVA